MKFKKILIIIVFVLSILSMIFHMNISNAADNAKITLTANETQMLAGDVVKVTVKIKDITGIADGINGIQGTLTYDNTIFESVTFEGLNNWDKPEYNEANGSFLTAKGDFVKNDEDVFTISLKVKSGAKLGDTKIQITDMQIADLDNEYSIAGTEITVKVVENKGNNENKGNEEDKKTDNENNNNENKGNEEDKKTDNENNNNENKGNEEDKKTDNENNNNENKGNEEDKKTDNENKTNNVITKKDNDSNKEDNTKSKVSIPKTGINGGIVIALGTVFLLIGTISNIGYQKYKNIK